ncbi:DUF6879 family protein [Streptomyces ficellus]|uniref:DUF6879 family protein n=1 Tax=Streptomyces ficellus TaxID=1977088 RepID=UPI00338E589C
MVPFTSITHLFREFKHAAWRLETRRGYASDRNSAEVAAMAGRRGHRCRTGRRLAPQRR